MVSEVLSVKRPLLEWWQERPEWVDALIIMLVVAAMCLDY